VHVKDEIEEDIYQYFKETNEFIKNALKERGKVFIFRYNYFILSYNYFL